MAYDTKHGQSIEKGRATVSQIVKCSVVLTIILLRGSYVLGHVRLFGMSTVRVLQEHRLG